MGSYTWKDSGTYTSGTTNSYPKDWNLASIYNNYVLPNIPPFSKITKVTFSIQAKQNLGGTNGDFRVVLSSTANTNGTAAAIISDQTKALTTSYKTFSADITSMCQLSGQYCGYFNAYLNGSASYIVAYGWATVIRKFSFRNISITWEFQDTYTISTSVSPSGSGYVSGGGSVKAGTNVSLQAVPNSGYKFIQWSDGKTNNPRSVYVTSDSSYTAYFEADKINKIYIGTSQPKKIYVGTQEVKAVYIGTTKIYG